MNFILVYIGRNSEVNLNFGLEHHIWGFKEHAAHDVKNYNDSDTYFAIADGYDGGSPRAQLTEWLQHKLAHIHIAKIISSVEKDVTPLWPDESDLAENERYIWRFRFGEVETLDNVSIAV